MRDFLILNWNTILVLAIVLIVVPLYFVVNKKWAELRAYSYRLIRLAEGAITGTKVGQERFNFVLQALYDFFVPKWARPFITKEKLAVALQLWYDELKDYLEDGKIDHSTPAAQLPEDIVAFLKEVNK